jgi:PAS domain S-box-containing protein
MDTTPDGIMIVGIDKKINYVNRAAERILGISGKDIEGRYHNDPLWKIAAADGSPIPDELLPYNQVINAGKTVYNVVYSIEQQYGKRISLSFNASPLYNAGKEIRGAVMSFIALQ